MAQTGLRRGDSERNAGELRGAVWGTPRFAPLGDALPWRVGWTGSLAANGSGTRRSHLRGRFAGTASRVSPPLVLPCSDEQVAVLTSLPNPDDSPRGTWTGTLPQGAFS